MGRCSKTQLFGLSIIELIIILPMSIQAQILKVIISDESGDQTLKIVTH